MIQTLDLKKVQITLKCKKICSTLNMRSKKKLKAPYQIGNISGLTTNIVGKSMEK